MQFRTYEDLNRTIIDNLYKIPHDVDLIVGVPRSGLMAALIVGLYLNLPVASVDDFLAGKLPASGTTKPKKGWIQNLNEARRVLVVEDSVYSGNSLNAARQQIQATSPYADKCIYMAIYVVPQSTSIPDLYCEIVNGIRIFQWNFLTHGMLADTCLDMDGVLCYDPTDEENDDGPRYRQFLQDARLKLQPKRPVGYIVTSRLEKYRHETAAWLENHDIQYQKLYMMQVATAEERRRLGNHAAYKAKIYKQLKQTQLFIESDDAQAQEIFALTNKPVFCIDSQRFYSDEHREHRMETRAMQKSRLKAAILSIGLFRRLNDLRKAVSGQQSAVSSQQSAVSSQQSAQKLNDTFSFGLTARDVASSSWRWAA